MRMLSRTSVTISAMALTAGLLIFLGIDALSEALELSGEVGGPFQGVGLVGIGVVVTFMLLDAISRRQRATGRGEAEQRQALALMIATGIGLHNLAEGLAGDEMGDDMIALPDITEEDVNPTRNDGEIDEQALQNLNSTPALTGAIPIAIFDAAMKNFHNEDRFGAEFYEMVLEFRDAPCLQKILEHVVDTMRAHKPTSPRTQICYIKTPTAGIHVTSAEFPRALGSSLARLKESALTHDLAQEVVSWLQPIADTENLDPSLKKVIQATLRTTERAISKE